jgi:hypothetical protein
METLSHPITAETMTHTLRKCAEKNIKKTKDQVPKRKLKCRTPEIQKKIRERRKAKRTYQQNPTTENLIIYKREKAQTRRAMKEESKTRVHAKYYIQNNRQRSLRKDWKNFRKKKVPQHQANCKN